MDVTEAPGLRDTNFTHLTQSAVGARTGVVMRARMTQIQENIRDSAGLFGLAKSNKDRMRSYEPCLSSLHDPS